MAILIDTANFSPNQTIDDIDREQYAELTAQLQDWDKDSVYKKVHNLCNIRQTSDHF